MDDFKKALDYAFMLLKYRNRTEKEIREKLKKKKYPPDTAENVVNKLKDLKFVDDKKFAEEFTKYNLEKGKGIILIRLELLRKGIAREILDPAIEEFKPSREQEYENAKILFYKKLKSCRKLPVEKIYSRISGHLARKGFSVETINRLFSEWKGELKEKLI